MQFENEINDNKKKRINEKKCNKLIVKDICKQKKITE